MRALYSVALVLFAMPAFADEITSSKFEPDKSGYPCTVEANTNGDGKFAINLSHYKGVWKISFFPYNIHKQVRKYFDGQVIDENRLQEDFKTLKVGGKTFDVEVQSFVSAKSLNKDATVMFDVEAKHNVVRLIDAMKADGISFGDFGSYTDTATALEEFRQCSLSALQVADGELIEVDQREEYRMIFEDAFDNWIDVVGRADGCSVKTYTEDDVQKLVETAAGAFYPGVMNYFQRSEYVEEIMSQAKFSRSLGAMSAITEGCLMVRDLTEIGRVVLDGAIDAAQNVD